MRTYTSPDRCQKVDAIYVGTTKYGSNFYQIRFNEGNYLPNMFTETICWSQNSRYCAAVEWTSNTSPKMQMIIFDTRLNMYIIVKKEGLFKNIEFSNNNLYFTVSLHGFLIKYRIDVLLLDSWSPLKNKFNVI